MKFINWAILDLLAILLISCNSKHRIWFGNENEIKIYNLKYGKDPKQVMDVYLPQQENRDMPLVILLHGGAWKKGRKENVVAIQNFLFKNKIPTVNLNYRLVNKRKKITYKDQLKDIENAIKSIESFSEKYQLNPNRIILLGESAGGHLALLFGYQNPDKISKIISLSGPTDFFSDDFLKTIYSRYALPIIEKMVGEKFNRKNVSTYFKKASPIYNVSSVPTLFFQGDLDIFVHKQQAYSLEKALKEKDIPHRFIFMKNTGHTPRFFHKRKREEIIYPEILRFIL